MQVLNSSWQLAGIATPSTLFVQNTGIPRIAYVFAAAQPAANAIVLDSGAHFVLLSGSDPLSLTNLKTEGTSMYVRALGSISGELSVDATV